MKKFKELTISKYQPPAKKEKDPDATAEEVKKQETQQVDIASFDVMYTKHMHQKSKVWDDGFLEYHIKPSKFILYAQSTRAECLDSKFFRTLPDLNSGEQFRMNKFIVEIDKRRLEGRTTEVIEKPQFFKSNA